MLIETFMQLYQQVPQATANIAVVCDIRSGELFGSFREVVKKLSDAGESPEVLFLDCEDDVLLIRFKETRRTPPLGVGMRLEEAIGLERQRLDPLKELASAVIDTSSLTPPQLRERLLGMYSAQDGRPPLSVTLLSFGFKYGMPADADFIFDARFLPNPYYEEQLRPLTGEDAAVRDYVMGCESAAEFLDSCQAMLMIAFPGYRQVHKYSATVAVGCTGGKHRSVALAAELAKRLNEKGFRVVTQHRDIQRI